MYATLKISHTYGGIKMSNVIQLGNTSLNVHPIGLGAMAVGGQNLFPQVDEQTSKELLKTAIHHGTNLIDTAFYYGFGRSEEVIGEVIKEMGKRQDVAIATKAAHQFVGDDIIYNNEPAFLKQCVDDALRRLQTDYIDLFYIHDPDGVIPEYEAVGALKELKDAGKIRTIGVSNYTPEQLKNANKDGYVDVYQGHYNLLNRSAEIDYFPYMIETGMSFVPYYPFAAGVLAGKYNKETIFDDTFRANKAHLQGEAFVKNLEKVEKLRPIADEKQADIAHIVLAWYLTREPIDVVIPGAKKTEHVLNNLQAANVKLTEDEVKKIDQIFTI